MTIEIRPADVEEILPLRKAVLRPMEPVVAAEYDGYPQVQHVGAFENGEVIGCATVFPSAYDGDAATWQLRGMAVEPQRQGTGIGGQVLAAAIDLARAAGASAVWANARTTALPFYASMGFEIVSEEFGYGPAELAHKRILLPLGT